MAGQHGGPAEGVQVLRGRRGLGGEHLSLDGSGAPPSGSSSRTVPPGDAVPSRCGAPVLSGDWAAAGGPGRGRPVSYTHLTLPTICSV
eukprot:14866420-Alexandrium_andersonii.AAC.1